MSTSTRSFGATAAIAQSDIWHLLDAPPPGYFGLELAPYTALTLSFETLSLTLANDSGELMHGPVNLQTAALTWIGPAPIPEPSTVALGLVGGLTLIVLRKRAAGARSLYRSSSDEAND